MREHSVHTSSLFYLVHGLHCSFSSPAPTSSQAPVSGTSLSKAVVLNRGHLAMSGDFFDCHNKVAGWEGLLAPSG